MYPAVTLFIINVTIHTYFELLILDELNCSATYVSLIQTAVRPYHNIQSTCRSLLRPLLTLGPKP